MVAKPCDEEAMRTVRRQTRCVRHPDVIGPLRALRNAGWPEFPEGGRHDETGEASIPKFPGQARAAIDGTL